jgi:hypothetical protein
MKKALISPLEPRVDNEGNAGYRVAHVVDQSYEVAPPLFWVDCMDNIEQDMWVYVDGALVDITLPPPDELPGEIPPSPINNFIEL